MKTHENLVCERYLSKFGYLASISAARNSKFFKAKIIGDDLMFDSNKKKTLKNPQTKSSRRWNQWKLPEKNPGGGGCI